MQEKIFLYQKSIDQGKQILKRGRYLLFDVIFTFATPRGVINEKISQVWHYKHNS